ncbi:MAG: DUF6353 family protein [Actinobacteria bacterium]|nr:DUF6353 family protein [Actinomycetota bacterium]
MNIARMMKTLEKATIDNSPAILTAIGIVGTVTTAYLTGKASIKASDMVREENEWIKDKGYKIPFDKQETVKLVWKVYIPPVTAGVLTIAAIYSANHVSTRRATAMAAAYSLSERAFSEYKEKVVEKLGEKKERAYRDEIAQDRVNENPSSDQSVIITNGGEVLCYDQFTGRYFNSSMETLRQAVNEINYTVLHQGYASLSDFYHEINVPTTSLSEELGWNTDQLLEIDYSTVMSSDGRPCIAINFNHLPVRKFDKFN